METCCRLQGGLIGAGMDERTSRKDSSLAEKIDQDKGKQQEVDTRPSGDFVVRRGLAACGRSTWSLPASPGAKRPVIVDG
jgi:translation elongation factor EF-G